MSQASWGRSGKQQQEQTSPNHVRRNFLSSVNKNHRKSRGEHVNRNQRKSLGKHAYCAWFQTFWAWAWAWKKKVWLSLMIAAKKPSRKSGSVLLAPRLIDRVCNPKLAWWLSVAQIETVEHCRGKGGVGGTRRSSSGTTRRPPPPTAELPAGASDASAGEG